MDELLRQILTELRGAWRYRWAAVIAAWAVALAGWVVVFALPSQYEATARVYVDTESAIRDFLKGMTAETNVATRVDYVRQKLLSRPYLEQVARETDLDLRAKDPKELEELIADLREDIVITSGTGRPRAGQRASFEENLYTIAYRDPSRATAESVVRTLLNAFMDDSLSGASNEPESARKFLEGQIALYAGRLSEAERRLAEFKREYVGMIPGEQGDHFTRLQAAIDRRDAARNELQIAQQRRGALLAQIQGTSRLPGEVKTPRGELEQKIADLETKLDELLLAYTDNHPDVVATRETLASLRQRLATMDASGSGGIAGATNPVYQQAQIALNDVDVEIASLRGQLAVQESRVAELQQLLETMPQVEAQLKALTRDYDVTRTNYEQLAQRLETAKLSGAVGDTGEDVAFRIIDPPLAPLIPVAPNRPALLALVLAAALAAGVGLAYLLHLLNPVFTTREQVYHELQVPVLGSVSMAWTPEQRALETASLRHLAVAVLALVVVGVGIFAAQRPLFEAVQRLFT